MKTTSAERGQNMFCPCSGNVLCFACSLHGNSMNNLLSYCGLVDAIISASEKDIPLLWYLKSNCFNSFFERIEDKKKYIFEIN